MKVFRVMVAVFIAVLVLSVWAPAPANALAADQPAAVKMVKLTINNRTGGSLYVLLTGPTSYYFAVTEQGKSKYTILSGTYAYTVTAARCGGSIHKTKSFKNGGSLGPYVCRK